MTDIADLAAKIRRQLDAPRAAARITLTPKLLADELTDDQIVAVAENFEAWSGAAVVYSIDDIALEDGDPYRCVQAHTSQAEWTPSAVPALWTPLRQTQGANPDPWVQPTGAQDVYRLGDRVTHNGQTWESTNDANSWEPGVFGWVVV